MCNAQGHNKQACRLVLHIIHIVLSAKQISCECHIIMYVGMIRQGKETPGPSTAKPMLELSRR